MTFFETKNWIRAEIIIGIEVNYPKFIDDIRSGLVSKWNYRLDQNHVIESIGRRWREKCGSVKTANFNLSSPKREGSIGFHLFLNVIATEFVFAYSFTNPQSADYLYNSFLYHQGQLPSFCFPHQVQGFRMCDFTNSVTIDLPKMIEKKKKEIWCYLKYQKRQLCRNSCKCQQLCWLIEDLFKSLFLALRS